MNLLNDIGDMMSGGKLSETTITLPYNTPLSSSSFSNSKRVLAVQERAISFTGEDFDVVDAETQESFLSVRGAMMHLPGKDKMRLKQNDGTVACTLDRKLMAMTPTYDILRSDDSKLGWIEKEAVSPFVDKFDVYLKGEGGSFGPLFKPPPAFQLEGDFLERNFCMRNAQGQIVAKCSMDWLIEFDAFNHYQVQVAPGMDAVLVVACLCAIDEEYDEEHKEKKKKESGEGGWPF